MCWFWGGLGWAVDLASFGMAFGPRFQHYLPQLLTRLEDVWRANGAPIADHLAPGATPEHLNAIEARIGYPIPYELRVWWEWHDGVQRLQPGTRGGRETEIGPGAWEFLSVEEAVEEWESRTAASAVGNFLPGFWNGQWYRHWLPVVRFHAYTLFVDCLSETRENTVPVRKFEHTPEDPFTPVAGAFTVAVLIWVEQLEQGVYQWSDEHQQWESDYASIPRSVTVFGPG